MDPIQPRGDFIDGRWRRPAAPDDTIEVRSPADLDDHVASFPTALAHVDAAIESARRAQAGWERTPLSDRCALLRRLGEELKAREDVLVALLGREVGKPAWEARTEVRALQGKIDITLGEGLELVRGFGREEGRIETRFRPHGVLAVVGPFNFPLHLSHGHIVPALATGNTVVLKSSEVAPACAQVYAEAFDAAGFPNGVFNLLQGRGPTGAALSSHEAIDGVLFTGSYATGVRILEANAHRPGRMLALELGGKNNAIVLADVAEDPALWEKTLYDVLFSAFVTAGQRCTAVSRVVIDRSIADRFAEELVERARRLVIGHPTDDGVFMGPLATGAARDRFLEMQEVARQEGAEELLASGTARTKHRGHYVSPAVHRVDRSRRDSRYQQTELFGPDLTIYPADDLEHVCAIAEDTDYGLAAAVFTREEEAFEACASRLQVGCLGWNVPTVGASSRLPFGGLKHSGNHRPAGLFSTLYCAWPLAITRGMNVLDHTKLPPGTGWTRPS